LDKDNQSHPVTPKEMQLVEQFVAYQIYFQINHEKNIQNANRIRQATIVTPEGKFKLNDSDINHYFPNNSVQEYLNSLTK
jgi:hypothetical protein